MSGCVTRTTSPRPSFRSEMNGGQSRDQNDAGSRARDPDAAPDSRPHVVVHHDKGSAVGTDAAGGTPRRVDVLAAGDDDDVIEDHVPDNDGPRDPQGPGESSRGLRPHTEQLSHATGTARGEHVEPRARPSTSSERAGHDQRRKYIASASSTSMTSTVTSSGVRLARSR